MIDIAKIEKADFVAHGSTGKGNDQVRFEVAAAILAPQIKTIAPLREWELNSREEEIDYARTHKIPIKSTKEKLYSVDKNIWGVSVEGGALEDITQEPPENSYYSVKPPKGALDEEVYLEIAFKEGLPVKLNGKALDLVSLINKLNKVGSACGIGRTDVIEDRVIGIKSREIYEAPAAWILHTAHKELEALCLDRQTLSFKEVISFKYAEMIYQGLWFTELKKSLDAFIQKTQSSISGAIGLKLYKGNIIIAKRSSAYALYKKELATYGKGDKFDRTYAEGFIKLWGMPFQK